MNDAITTHHVVLKPIFKFLSVVFFLNFNKVRLLNLHVQLIARFIKVIKNFISYVENLLRVFVNHNPLMLLQMDWFLDSHSSHALLIADYKLVFLDKLGLRSI
jgi:hypothetical protein